MTAAERSAFATKHPDFADAVTSSTLLPGLEEGYTPQGLTRLTPDLLLVTSYRGFHVGSKAPSLFIIMNTTAASDASLLAIFTLHNTDGTPFYGHCGGAASVADLVYTVNDYELLAFDREQLLGALVPDTVVLLDIKPIFTEFVDSKASYVFSDNERLYVGDFYEPVIPFFSVPSHHGPSGWVAGYDLDESGRITATDSYSLGFMVHDKTVLKPDLAIQITAGVQGIILCDSTLALSLAFGLYDATLALYPNPLSTEPTTTELPDGSFLPTYTLAKEPSSKIALPTGSEDLDCDCDSNTAQVLFESASTLYRTPIRLAGGSIEDRTFSFTLPAP